MMENAEKALWVSNDVQDATGGQSPKFWQATGVSIDSRTLDPGDLFVALKGPTFDGHEYVVEAFQKGASASLISKRPSNLPTSAQVLKVEDTYVGLKKLGVAGRARTNAKIIAVTGSVGKTSVKEALAKLLESQGTVSYSQGGLNNHYGVPLSLARLNPSAKFGIFEIGMNHAGEIEGLSRLVRPKVALITKVENAHIGNFRSTAEIAKAKAEIFLGLEDEGFAVLNRDNQHYDLLEHLAETAGVGVVSFGAHKAADMHLKSFKSRSESTEVFARIDGVNLQYEISMPGYHWVENSLGILAAIKCVGADIFLAASNFKNVGPVKGRGIHHRIVTANYNFRLIDDSYNASPVSIGAALDVVCRLKIEEGGRRIVVFGDMLELGKQSKALHLAVTRRVNVSNVDLVFAIGIEMKSMFDGLLESKQGKWAITVDEIIAGLVGQLQEHDIVLVKGSFGMKMGLIVERLLKLQNRV